MRFHVLINPAAVRPGETVRLYGDLAALGGGFHGPGIAMAVSYGHSRSLPCIP